MPCQLHGDGDISSCRGVIHGKLIMLSRDFPKASLDPLHHDIPLRCSDASARNDIHARILLDDPGTTCGCALQSVVGVAIGCAQITLVSVRYTLKGRSHGI